MAVALPLCVLTGLMGGHRFYLERTGTGVLMLLTGGGMGVWWLVDLLRLRSMVTYFNADQALRRREGRPPVGLDFLEETEVPAAARMAEPSLVSTVGDAVVAGFAGLMTGAMAVAVGVPEPFVVVLALLVAVNASLRRVRTEIPVLRELLEWEAQLLAFYRRVPPGGPIGLLLRPLIGAVSAPFSKRARSEARLYLELGGVFLVLFMIQDLVTDYAPTVMESGLSSVPQAWFEDLVQAFLMVYALSTPVGATLNKQLVLRRSSRWVAGLSAVVVIGMGLGVALALVD